MTLEELNHLPDAEAAQALRACCGAHRWVNGMLERRPFRSVDDALAAADDIWSSLGEPDWLEAFSHHPRIGERRAAVTQDARGSQWSSSEQDDVARSAEATRDALAEINRAYEEKFGHIYLVCASGKSADELLAIARRRLHNDPAHERRVAADEQRQITRLRLIKLLTAAA